jgi:hypothetical protein
MNDGYRCELCGAWIEYRNLGNVLDHEGPLPHGTQDRLAGKWHRPRPQKPAKALR